MSQKIRHIVHLSSAEIWRGAEQQIIYLYDGLKNIGVKQTIICNEKGSLAEYCKNHHYSYLTYHRDSGINWNLVKSIKALHKIHPIDIIHIHDPHAHHAYILAHILGTKIPAILHRRVDFKTADYIFSRWKYEYTGIKKIICVSKNVQEVLNQSRKIEDKSIVIYDCVDIQSFQKINGRNILEKEYPQLQNKFIIGHVAALVDHKDHLTFIKAAHHLVKILQMKNLHFIMIGKGEKYHEIQQTIHHYRLQNDITMMDHRNDIADILNGLDVYTFTSKMEGFGSTILEVMSAKVPIVATDIGGPKEILSHNIDALIAKVGDHIRLAHHIDTLYNDTPLRNTLVQSAFQKVQNFSVEQYVNQIQNIYQEID